MSRVTIGPGQYTDARTAAMLKEAQRLCGVTFSYSQASYSTSVGQSAGTHALAAVVDIRTVPLGTMSKKLAVVKALRRVGFAAWFRPYRAGVWGEHIHAVAIQPGGKYDQGVLARAAHTQVKEHYNGGDGLSGSYPDPHRDMGLRIVTWERFKARPVVSYAKLGFGKPASNDVKAFQQALNWLLGIELVVDGKYGAKTHEARLHARRRLGKRGVALVREIGIRYSYRTTS